MRGHNSFLIIITSKLASKNSKNSKTSIQRGKKLGLKGISRHFMLSIKCALLLLGLVLSILSSYISNLSLLCSTPPSRCCYWNQSHKEAENGSEDIAAGVAVVLVAFCSQTQKGGGGYLRQIV